MKIKLLICSLMIYLSANAQVFDWETAYLPGAGSAIRQDVNNVSATFLANNLSGQLINGNGVAGTSGNIVVANTPASSVTFYFNPAIDIQSIHVFDNDGSNASDWTFSSPGNSNIIESVTSSNGNNVIVNWTKVSSFQITSSSGVDSFGIDDIVFSTCNVTIPDVNFKNQLLGNSNINTNNDTEIHCLEASSFSGGLVFFNSSISSFEGIEAFTGLTTLWTVGNQITSLDVSNNTNLRQLICNQNQISSISLNPLLEELLIDNNQLTNLDVSALPNLYYLHCRQNQLTTLNVANGNNSNFTNFDATSNANLACIQVDDVNYSNNNWPNKDATTNYGNSCTTLSIPEVNLNEMSLYPNPTATVLNIEMHQNFKQAIIYSILGDEVLKTTSKVINTSNLKAGMYIITIEDKTGSITTKRFIKQ